MKGLKGLVRSGIVLLMLLVVMTACNVIAAKKDEYPSKPITLIVPFSAGGTSDLVARVLAETSKKYISQPMNIVNRPGGSGTVGTSEVVMSKPDGYTLGFLAKGELSGALHLIKAPYNLDSYTVFCQVDNSHHILVVSKDAKWRNLKEFIDYAKEHPKKINVAIPGKGTSVHITGEHFCQITGTELNFVPFQGSGPIIPALLGGHVDATILNIPEILSQYKANNVNILAVFGDKRVDLIKDAPTALEQGYRVMGGATHYIVGPNGTPAKTADAIRKLMQQIMNDEKFKNLLASMGSSVDYLGTSESKEFLKEWYQITGEIYKKLGMIR